MGAQMARRGSAKEEMNSTPIRTRDMQNKENSSVANNRPKDLPRRSEMQETEGFTYDSILSSKTVPKRRVSVSPRGCANHDGI